jgi:hypothetical protein
VPIRYNNKIQCFNTFWELTKGGKLMKWDEGDDESEDSEDLEEDNFSDG